MVNILQEKPLKANITGEITKIAILSSEPEQAQVLKTSLLASDPEVSVWVAENRSEIIDAHYRGLVDVLLLDTNVGKRVSVEIAKTLGATCPKLYIVFLASDVPSSWCDLQPLCGKAEGKPAVTASSILGKITELAGLTFLGYKVVFSVALTRLAC